MADVISKEPLTVHLETSNLPIEAGKKLENGATVQTSSEYLDHREDFSGNEYITGWRLHLITLALCMGIFSAQMESSIVSTSIVAITNELGGFDKSSWVFTGFMLTYAGLIMIWAKLSDIFGRKPLILFAITSFIAASGGCGGSQTLYELIGLRCFQGMGASGIYSIGSIIFFEIVPPRKFPHYTALVSMVITCSVVFGPLLGGLINTHTTWRWVFYLNLPVGCISLVLLIILLPSTMPNQKHTNGTLTNVKALPRVDIIGATLLLGICIFVVTPLQFAVTGDSFGSTINIVLFIFAGVFLIAFMFWERFVTTKRELPEAVFPWRFFLDRRIMGMILNVFFAGGVLTVCTIQLPQRFQTVNDNTAFKAATQLIPFGIFIPTAGAISSMLISKTRIAPIYFAVAAIFFQTAGTVGLSRANNSHRIHPSQYGFQILAGIGVGLINAPLICMIPFVVQKRDLAVGTAVLAQFRILGGIMGLSIVISIMNRTVRSELLQVLPPLEVEAILASTGIIENLPVQLQDKVRSIFGRGYNLQMSVMIGFAVAQLPATALMWTRDPVMVAK